METSFNSSQSYAAWLADQAKRDDQVGWLAQRFAETEGNRPRMSAPSTVERWLIKCNPDNKDYVHEAHVAALTEWRDGKERERHLHLVQSAPPQASPDLLAEVRELKELVRAVGRKLGLELPGADLETAGDFAVHQLTGQSPKDQFWAHLAATADYTGADQPETG